VVVADLVGIIHFFREDPAMNPIVQPYLTFSGRCEEAMAFYRTAVGAKVEEVLLFKDSPDPLPPGMLAPGFENKVMHCSFRIGDSTVMASDGCDTLARFGAFSLAMSVDKEAEAHRAFNALAVGGNVQMPMGKTFWSPCFGMVTDKFGVGWMVMVPGEAAK
jgi:PhnB protein